LIVLSTNSINQLKFKEMTPFTRFSHWRNGIARKDIENENKLLKAQVVIEEYDHLKKSFLNNISQEMRNPLNSMLGHAQLILKSEDVSGKIQNDVKMIIENGNQLSTMISNIIDEAKLEAGQIKLRKNSLCLNSLMDRLYNLFLENPAYIRKSSDIELKYDKPCMKIAIMCDPERLLQVMVNLIDNALKFTDKGIIRFGYSFSVDPFTKDQYITFYVKDTGIGIPKDKTEKIFEPFVQFNDVKSGNCNGAGLGLPLLIPSSTKYLSSSPCLILGNK